MKTQLYVFWRYDLFPFVLGSPALEMNAKGKVLTEGYGQMWVKPIKLLPLAEGKALHRKLESLTAELGDKERDLKRVYLKK